MKMLIALPDFLITPEMLDHTLSLGLSIFTKRDERAAARGALADAAVLCDKMADEIMAQNRKGNHVPPKLACQMAAAFKRCGDEIMRMRERVNVPKE